MDLPDPPRQLGQLRNLAENEWIIHQNGQILVMYEFLYGTWGRTEQHITLVGEIVSPSQFHADIYVMVDIDKPTVVKLKNISFNRQSGKEVNSD